MTNANQPIATAQMLIRRPVAIVFEAFVDPVIHRASGSAAAAADWKPPSRCDGIGACTVWARRWK
jgi:hypothetical protein